jgi:hypothetical protein
VPANTLPLHAPRRGPAHHGLAPCRQSLCPRSSGRCPWAVRRTCPRPADRWTCPWPADRAVPRSNRQSPDCCTRGRLNGRGNRGQVTERARHVQSAAAAAVGWPVGIGSSDQPRNARSNATSEAGPWRSVADPADSRVRSAWWRASRSVQTDGELASRVITGTSRGTSCGSHSPTLSARNHAGNRQAPAFWLPPVQQAKQTRTAPVAPVR